MIDLCLSGYPYDNQIAQTIATLSDIICWYIWNHMNHERHTESKDSWIIDFMLSKINRMIMEGFSYWRPKLLPASIESLLSNFSPIL